MSVLGNVTNFGSQGMVYRRGCFCLKIETKVLVTVWIKHGTAARTRRGLHVTADCHLGPADSAENGFGFPSSGRPALDRVVFGLVVALVTRVIAAAATKLNGDDIQLGVVMHTARLVVDYVSKDFDSMSRHEHSASYPY